VENGAAAVLAVLTRSEIRKRRQIGLERTQHHDAPRAGEVIDIDDSEPGRIGGSAKHRFLAHASQCSAPRAATDGPDPARASGVGVPAYHHRSTNGPVATAGVRSLRGLVALGVPCPPVSRHEVLLTDDAYVGSCAACRSWCLCCSPRSTHARTAAVRPAARAGLRLLREWQPSALRSRQRGRGRWPQGRRFRLSWCRGWRQE
jgi:hypothetical protein